MCVLSCSSLFFPFNLKKCLPGLFSVLYSDKIYNGRATCGAGFRAGPQLGLNATLSYSDYALFFCIYRGDHAIFVLPFMDVVDLVS